MSLVLTVCSLVYMRPKTVTFAWSKYTDAFSPSMWIVLGVTIILASIAIWLTESNSRKASLYEAVLFTCTSLAQRGSLKSELNNLCDHVQDQVELDAPAVAKVCQVTAVQPTQKSQRIAYLTVTFLGFLVFSAYCGVVTSFLATTTPEKTLQGLDELFLQTDLTLTLLESTQHVDVLKRLGVYPRFARENRLKLVSGAGKLRELKIALMEGDATVIGDHYFSVVVNDVGCNLVKTKQWRSLAGFVVQKGELRSPSGPFAHSAIGILII